MRKNVRDPRPWKIDIAKKLDMTVVAEGVETIDQVEFFETHGCNTIQGWYFSQDVSSEEIMQILSTGFEYFR